MPSHVRGYGQLRALLDAHTAISPTSASGVPVEAGRLGIPGIRFRVVVMGAATSLHVDSRISGTSLTNDRLHWSDINANSAHAPQGSSQETVRPAVSACRGGAAPPMGASGQAAGPSPRTTVSVFPSP